MSVVEGVRISPCAVAVLEICAARGRASGFIERSRGLGVDLPGIGSVAVHADQLILCTRPERWQVLSSPAGDASGEPAPGAWPAKAAPAAVIDLTGACAALWLQGAHARAVLARGCRLDLDPRQFPLGRAAATTMAQVPVTLASLADGMLLLTPASTARHVHAWLSATAQSFALVPQSPVSVADLCRSRMQ